MLDHFPGHFLMLENPEAYSQTIIQFFKSVSDKTKSKKKQ